MGIDTALTGIPDFDQFELVKEGIVSVSVGATAISITNVVHNLGYQPLVLAAVDYGNSRNILPSILSSSVGVGGVTIFQFMQIIGISNTAFSIQFLNANADPYTNEVKYYLLRQRSK